MASDGDGAADLRVPWNRTAASYAEVFAGSITQAIVPLLDAADVATGTRLLDVATGPGIIAAAARERNAVPVGVDFAENMVEVARATHPQIEFALGDAADLKYGDESFDAVVMGFALFMMPEPHRALREAHRVLVPGARFACSLWDWPVPGFDLFYSQMEKYLPEEPLLGGGPPLFGVSDRDVLKGALSEAGFNDVAVEPLPIVWEMASADQLFDALATLRDLSGLSDEQRDSFRADVVSGAQDFLQGGRYHIPFPALVLRGQK